MLKIKKQPRFALTKALRAGVWLTVFSLVVLLVPNRAGAAGQLTGRSLTLSTSASNTSATWTFSFTATETTALNGVTFQPCTTASGSCSTPGSWSNSGSAAGTISNIGSGFTLDNASGYLRIKNNSNATTVTNPVSISFTTVTNPTLTNATFYVRILTYSGDDYTSQVDNGVVAAAIVPQISVSATVDESLVFCTGTSGITSSSCASATGTSVSLGSLTTSTTGTGTSQLGVSTNSESGYAITINGTTLTSGSNTISALASQTASSAGSEQFGVNLKDNATPNIGSDPAGAGSANPTANYNTADQFRFVTADAVASKSTADQFRLFTVSYIANINSGTEPGTYSTTLTYICTATF